MNDTGQPEQVATARRYVKREGVVYVPQIVQVETVWVLESAYKLRREDIFPVLAHLDENESYILQNTLSFHWAMQQYIKGDADFSDYLILAESRQEKLGLLTFEKKLSKLTGVVLAK